MSENQKKILQMLADGKINVDEAQRLLSLVGTEREAGTDPGESTKPKGPPKYMYVVIRPKPGAPPRPGYHGSPVPPGAPTPPRFTGTVNVRVPFGLIRAGMKLATLIPPEAADRVNDAMKEKGMTFDIRKLKPEDLEELVNALQDSEINVDSAYETVRVYAE